MATVITPPNALPDGFSVFLAGSIEMGGAEPWQKIVEHALASSEILIFNPRRDEWDARWEQSASNPQFHEQVSWELDALTKAHQIVFYFDPATKSPVSLLELGLFASSAKVIVCCPPGFWRKGNVDIVCQRYGIPQVATLTELSDWILAVATNPITGNR